MGLDVQSQQTEESILKDNRYSSVEDIQMPNAEDNKDVWDWKT